MLGLSILCHNYRCINLQNAASLRLVSAASLTLSRSVNRLSSASQIISTDDVISSCIRRSFSLVSNKCVGVGDCVGVAAYLEAY